MTLGPPRDVQPGRKRLISSDPLEGGLKSHATVLVTGAAGFLGSHLSERLIDEGHQVRGVDCFTDFYARSLKQANLARVLDEPSFTFVELDLSADDLDGLLEGIDVVFHLAAQPGVRTSFGEGFEAYLRHNVRATQRLLEASIGSPLMSLVYASSSSVYGNPGTYPTTEGTRRRAISPYGMTKAATEDLARIYHESFEVPVVGLRYFTAYGPRQRPDMAFTRFLTRFLSDEPLPILGDGSQVRDFTYVDDIVAGTIAAAEHGSAGWVYNIGGAHPVPLIDAIRIIERLGDRPARLQHLPAQVGDPLRTGCDPEVARRHLDYRPTTSLEDGLAAQLEWLLATERYQPALAPR